MYNTICRTDALKDESISSRSFYIALTRLATALYVWLQFCLPVRSEFSMSLHGFCRTSLAASSSLRLTGHRPGRRTCWTSPETPCQVSKDSIALGRYCCCGRDKDSIALGGYHFRRRDRDETSPDTTTPDLAFRRAPPFLQKELRRRRRM